MLPSPVRSVCAIASRILPDSAYGTFVSFSNQILFRVTNLLIEVSDDSLVAACSCVKASREQRSSRICFSRAARLLARCCHSSSAEPVNERCCSIRNNLSRFCEKTY